MVSHLRFLILSALVALVAAQPPRPNGIDAQFFSPAGPDVIVRGGPAPSPAACRTLRLRENDGRCTHLTKGELGRAGEVHFSYFNVDSRQFMDGGRKSPRVISNIVSNQDEDILSSRNLNELTTFFGQFVDHNFASTPLSDDEMDIEPDEDVDGPKAHFPFRRSSRAQFGAGPAERPINVLPTALDLVAVYGNNDLRNAALRVPNSCLMKTSAGDLLPFNTEGLSNAPTDGPEFYVAGDTRPNEHPILAVIHTIWLREHNYLCDKVGDAMPFLSPSAQYDIARAINIAEFQKVVYEEFFPAVTGRVLSPPYRGFRFRADPTLSSLFSTAAFRVGHTMVGDRITEIASNGATSSKSLAESFFVPESIGDGIDPFLRGVTRTRSQEIDVKVVDGLRNMLFEFVDEEEGPDLIAINLQRSRDHNIASFNEIRKFCRIRTARTFADISSDPETRSRLEEAYGDVDLVEAWPGLMAEDHLRGSSIGRTLFEVWRKEFLRLRDGDQFFFRNRKSFFFRLRRRRALRSLINPILGRGDIFARILLRNSGIRRGDLNVRNVFMTP